MFLMQNPPDLTDRTTLLRNRKRAAKAPADFLRQAVADEVHERLTEVNRTFTSPLIVTGHPEIWVDSMPDATICADEDILQVEPAKHDLVIHDLNLHWANDLVGQLVQSRRALKPDGLFIGTLFGGQTLQELRVSLAEAEAAVTGGLSPRIAPMAEIRDLGGLLQRAGFALPVADATPFTVNYTRRNVMTEAAGIYATNYTNEDGRINATFEIVTLTGWAPDDSQQKPLRPGSAKSRLADALGVPEKPLKD